MDASATQAAREHGRYLVQEMIRHLRETAPDHAGEHDVSAEEFVREALKGAHVTLTTAS